MSIPRPEYPRPQMTREKWMNLNGEWEFAIDHGDSGIARGQWQLPMDRKIIVPFCPESKLSGVAYKDFMAAVWYRRTFELPDGWQVGRTILHFGAVDYQAKVWVNGKFVGTHEGGYVSFSFDITDYVYSGQNTVAVYAKDDTRSGRQPTGKQSHEFFSHHCDYTRTTGIWQTVWLENVPTAYISELYLTPDVENVALHIRAKVNGGKGLTLFAQASLDGEIVGDADIRVCGDEARGTIDLSELRLWEIGNPNLYDLEITMCEDVVRGYFGMRKVTLHDGAILLNDKKVFQRLILDQGFYPEGIYTAPADDELRADIERSMAMGFNGARLHQKIFEPRFLYWADKLGYIVWGEHGNWGLDVSRADAIKYFLPEWMEAVSRDYNHPAIVGWCPFNETHPRQHQDDEVLRIVYLVTKQMDPTRPVIDTSGYTHVITDIYDIHNYEQDVRKFSALFEPMASGGEIWKNFPKEEKFVYDGQPYFVSEYGGIWWAPGDPAGWGYGQRPSSEEDFIERYRGLTNALLDNPKICALCYTQLTDVEQEVNGLYTYDRKPKFDPKIIYAITSRKAAIEE